MLKRIFKTEDFTKSMSPSGTPGNQKILHWLVLNNLIVSRMRFPLRFAQLRWVEDKYPHVHASSLGSISLKLKACQDIYLPPMSGAEGASSILTSFSTTTGSSTLAGVKFCDSQ